jgi:hypothetical protein
MSRLSPPAAHWSVFQRTLIYFAAACLTLLATRWLYLFALTDYRSHGRSVVIPLALLTLALARPIPSLIRTVVILLGMTGLAGAGALSFEVTATGSNPFMVTIVAVFILYIRGLLPAFKNTPD